MKNENDKVRAFAMEVIEFIDEMIKECINEGFNTSKFKLTLDFVQSLLPKEEEVDWYQKPFKELIGMRFRDVTYTDNIITIGHNHTIETDKDGDVYLSFGGDAVGWIKQHGVLAEIVEPETKTESDDVKAGGIDRTPRYVRAFNPSHHEVEDVYFTGGTCDENEFIMQGAGGYFFTIGAFSEIEPTLEQKARKKAEEMFKEVLDLDPTDVVLFKDTIFEALLIDPKTL